MKYKVIKNYNDAPANPISIEKGEKLDFIKESNPNGDWAGWIFCKGCNKEGWVPKQILEIKNGKITSLEKYTAKEHNLKLNEILISEKELNGWIWCKKEANSNAFAWAPLNHLQKL